MSRNSLRKSAFALLVSLLFSWACYGEKSYTITESGLDEIQAQTDLLMMKVGTLTESVKRLENQRNEYLTLSDKLRQENEKLQAKVRNYRTVTIGLASGAIIAGLTAYILRQ